MILNLNIGLLGHVDSGKTSLAKVLSEIESTAAFDKNPQSQLRGITIDLGFSALEIELPEHLKPCLYEKLQVTFVDCPGHSSLIRTIIGGSQIIDQFLLIIDITKGMQTQTSECLIIGSITCKRMIIVLNKIDLLDETCRNEKIEKMTKNIRKMLSNISAFSEAPIVSLSATKNLNITNLIETLSTTAFIPDRNIQLPLLVAIDHCFPIKGQVACCTGTVLQGQLKINQSIEIPHLKIERKIKSIQMFRKPIDLANPGDRIGMCIPKLDPKLFERGLISVPGYVSDIRAAVIKFNKIKYFKGKINSNSKFHISIGYETVMANIILIQSENSNEFNFESEYLYIDEINDHQNLTDNIFVLLEFERPIISAPDSLLIGSKLDITTTNECRLAFWSHLNVTTSDKNYNENFFSKIKIYKIKTKTGNISRVINNNEIITNNLFKKESSRQLFIGMNIKLSFGQSGKITETFGQTSKMKIILTEELTEENLKNLKNCEILLIFKKYIFNKNNKLSQ